MIKSSRPVLFFFFAFLIGFTSCTVEKRVHLPGYHVEWNHKTKKIDSTTNPSAVDDLMESVALATPVEIDVDSQVVTASSNDDDIMPIIGSTPSFIDVKAGSNDNTSRTSQIHSDAMTTFDDAITTAPLMSKNEVRNAKRSAKSEVKAAKKTNSSGKSQLVALVLVLLVGVLGIHRFYLGHIGIGILMLLTGGLCGILVLVDLIMILTGDLKPKDGEYTTTL